MPTNVSVIVHAETMSTRISHRFRLADVGPGRQFPTLEPGLAPIDERREIDALQLTAPLASVAFPKDAFVGAVVAAYNEHCPLGLDPDAIWLRVAQSVGTYVFLNADDPDVRGRLVSHEGTPELRVCVDKHGVVLRRHRQGGRCSPADCAPAWAGAVAEMTDLIAARTTPAATQALLAGFSGTTSVHRTALCCSLMSMMQKYFEYTFYTRCGIPEVTLYGTPADYDAVVHRATALARLFPKFGWYFKRLMPTLHKLRDSAHGRPDLAWWRGAVSVTNESGAPYMTGWITDFVAYVKPGGTGACERAGPTVSFADVYPAVMEAPFFFEDLTPHRREKLPMFLLSGFFGLTQHAESRELRPVVGWATVHADTSPVRGTQPEPVDFKALFDKMFKR